MSIDRLHDALEAARIQRDQGLNVDPNALAMEHGVSAVDLRDALLALDTLKAATTSTPPLPLPLLPSDYVLGPELGRGGMGVVYRARQRSLQRDVAVKVLRPGELIFGEALKRFQREARVLAKLRHPHIVPIHEVGEVNGLVFFAMDLFEGGSLADLLAKKRRPMPIARVTRLMRQVTGAVAFVHRHGLVHRDLKPANVLLDEAGEAYVADFGLAVDPSEGATLTATGGLLGTPDYMAPEQARGERAAITERTDVYALGVMLYECLTGRKPFGERAFVDKVYAIVHEEPPSPRKVVREVPIELERVCLQAMAKEPSERYATASALATDLERFEQGLPVTARGASAAGRLVRSARRHRGRVVAGAHGAAAMALALFVGGLGGLGQSLEERLADAQHLEAAGEVSAADLLYTKPFEQLRGKALTTEPERELALGGMLAALRAYDAAPSATQAARAMQLKSDAEWLVAQCGATSMLSWAFKVGVADRIGDPIAALSRFRAWLQQRTLVENEGQEFVDACIGALGAFVSDPAHPLLGASSVLIWELWGENFPHTESRFPAPKRWTYLALCQRSLAGYGGLVDLNVVRGPTQWLGAERFDPELEEELLRLAEDSRATDHDRGLAARYIWRTLDIPPPMRPANAPSASRDRSQDVFDEATFRDVAHALRATRGATHEVRRLALGDAYVATVEAQGREAAALIWTWFRGAFGLDLETRDVDGLLERWTEVRKGDLRTPLRDALGLSPDVVLPELIAQLNGGLNSTRLGWLHELLLLSVDDPIRAPAWAHLADPFDDLPSDLVGSWQRFLGHDPFGGPHNAAFALILWPEGVGGAQLVAHWNAALATGDEIESVAEFDLPRGFRGIDWRGPLDATPIGSGPPPERGRVRVSATLRNGPKGILAEMTARVTARMAGATTSRASALLAGATPAMVAPGRIVTVQEGLVSWCPWTHHGQPAHRFVVVVRLDPPEAELRGEWDFDDWSRALVDELVRFGGPDRGAEPVAAKARKAFWGELTPVAAARLACDVGQEDLSLRLRAGLTPIETGMEMGHSGDGVRHIRAVELALGRTRDSAVQVGMDWLDSLGRSSLELPLAGLLAGSDDAEVRAAARTDFAVDGVTLAELERIEEMHRRAETTPPADAVKALAAGRGRVREVERGRRIQWLHLLAAAVGAALCWGPARSGIVSTCVALAFAGGAYGSPEIWMPSLGSSAVDPGRASLVAAACGLAALAARRGWRPVGAAMCVASLALLVLAQWAPLPELWHLCASLAMVAAAVEVAARGWHGGHRFVSTVGAGLFAWAALPAVAVRAAELVERHDWASAAWRGLPGAGNEVRTWCVVVAVVALGFAVSGSRQVASA